MSSKPDNVVTLLFSTPRSPLKDARPCIYCEALQLNEPQRSQLMELAETIKSFGIVTEAPERTSWSEDGQELYWEWVLPRIRLGFTFSNRPGVSPGWFCITLDGEGNPTNEGGPLIVLALTDGALEALCRRVQT